MQIENEFEITTLFVVLINLFVRCEQKFNTTITNLTLTYFILYYKLIFMNDCYLGPLVL